MELYGQGVLERPIIVPVCEADVAALEAVAEEHDRKALQCFTGNVQTDRENAAFFWETSAFARNLGRKVCELAIPVADECSTPVRFIALSVWEKAFLSLSVRKPQVRRIEKNSPKVVY